MSKRRGWVSLKEEWLLTCRANTRAAYAIALRQYEAWAASAGRLPKRPSDVTVTDCHLFREHLNAKYGVQRRDQGWVAISQTPRSKFMALRSFLNHCERSNVLDGNPARSIRYPMLTLSRPRRVLPREAIPAMLAAAELKIAEARLTSDGTKEARWRLLHALQCKAMLLVLSGTGCRVGEVCSLRWDDLEGEGDFGRIRILGKGGRTSYPLVRKEVIESLCALPREKRSRNDSVFLSSTGKPANHKYVSRVLRELCLESGFPPITAHSVRAMVATELHVKGVPIVEIKNLLGHASIETTSRYIRFADEAKHAAGLKIDFLG